MKKLLILLMFFATTYQAVAQNKTLGVGISSPNTNAALHVESPTSNQGFIMPRLTTAQRSAMATVLTATDTGLMLYDTDLATKPGVLLTEKNVNEKIDELVPMGVIGVIPTKVCLENGPIKRGDLLVTSSKAGHAMKAVSKNADGVFPAGVIIGKALENFDADGSGLIKVLVNVK